MKRLLYVNKLITIIALIIITIVLSSFSQAGHLAKKRPYLHPSTSISSITSEINGQYLSIYIDQKKFMDSLPRLQKMGALDANLTATEASFYKPLLPASVSVSYVANIVKNLYKSHPNLDQIKVRTYMRAPDSYGHVVNAACYSFDFNRRLYQQINWATFQPDNLREIAPNFNSSALCQEVIGTIPADI